MSTAPYASGFKWDLGHARSAKKNNEFSWSKHLVVNKYTM
jgi:hypothetical protein